VHHFINRRKRNTTHTHTQDSDTEDDTTPALMNQQRPIVHEQDPFVWSGMSRRYSGYQEVPNSRLEIGRHSKNQEWVSAIKLIYVALRVILIYMVTYFLVQLSHLRCIYNFFSRICWSITHHCINRRKRSTTHTRPKH
jgi:hypothetical protein